MGVFGSPLPRLLGNGASVPAFPSSGSTYTDSTGSIVVPAGWGTTSWYAYRATLGAARGEVVCIGDSTLYGSQGNYSITQRLRDRAISFGLADGGKGMFGAGESAIGYDSPEVNGYVSASAGWAATPDGWDNLDGQFYYDNGTTGAVLTLQFRATCARLWYSKRQNSGDFTYSVDGGAAVTVNAHTTSGNPYQQFVYISGLSANTTHTIAITNLATGGGTGCYVALSPMNAAGVVFHKYATSGDTMVNRFFASAATSPFTQALDGFRYQESFGLAGTSVGSTTSYRGAAVDTTQPAGGTIRPVLALSNLGFNDLTSAATYGAAMWTEYVKRFAGACRDAGCDGVIVAGQLPYNAQWPTYGADRFNALKTQALASGLAFVDSFYPVAGPSLSYSGGTANPHLLKPQYVAQADFIWDGLLGLAA